MRKLTIIQPRKPDPEPVDPIEIDASLMIGVKRKGGVILSNTDDMPVCAVRETGEFSNGAIWLNYAYDWEIGEDSEGTICLVPLEKP